MGFLKRHWQWFLGGAIVIAWWRLSSGDDGPAPVIQVPKTNTAADNRKLAGF